MFTETKIKKMVDNCAHAQYLKNYQGKLTGFVLSYENLQEMLQWAYNEGLQNGVELEEVSNGN
jgi:pyridoxal/pyridoxine/pyridoxamine kinase